MVNVFDKADGGYSPSWVLSCSSGSRSFPPTVPVVSSRFLGHGAAPGQSVAATRSPPGVPFAPAPDGYITDRPTALLHSPFSFLLCTLHFTLHYDDPGLKLSSLMPAVVHTLVFIRLFILPSYSLRSCSSQLDLLSVLVSP